MIDFSKGFTKPNLKALTPSLEAALKDFAKQHGLEVELNGGKFDAGSFTPRVSFKKADIAKASDDANLESWMKISSLTKKESSKYVLTGYNSKAQRYPWIARSKVDGKSYKLDDDTARRHFA